MKRKLIDGVFLFIGIGVCLTPFFGMSMAKTDATLEKRALAEFPKIMEEGKPNPSYGKQLGDYFHDHFAWKNEFVTLDSLIQGKVFGVSAVETVLVGTDGWLYYRDSLDDYLGRGTLSTRGAKNLVHNLELMQQRVEGFGAQFLFTIAPNKNTLYNANMPYYTGIKASGGNNADGLAPLLLAGTVHYADLFQAFRDRTEVLYRKQDSHWNEKGAALAYDTIMSALQKEHRDYTTTPYLRTRSKIGDLATALYALAAKEEWDGEYQYKSCVSFQEDDMDWEAAWVQTKGEGKSGNLLMYRDSFGNTLSPLMAEDYGKASFSRENVYLLDQELEQARPDTVVVEIVERNVDRFVRFHPEEQAAEGPPLMQAPVVAGSSQEARDFTGHAKAAWASSQIQPTYTVVYGLVDPSMLEEDTEISVEILDEDGKGTEYAAFQTCGFEEGTGGYLTENPSWNEAGLEGDNGFVAYFKTEDLPAGQLKLRVLLTGEDGGRNVVDEQEFAAR